MKSAAALLPLLFTLLLLMVGCANEETLAERTDTSETEVSATAEGCPEQPPYLSNSIPWHCESEGQQCTWPATGCQPGERPPNECTCTRSGWQCEGHFHNCLPVPSDGLDERLGVTKTMPAHRPLGGQCAPTPTKTDALCNATHGMGEGECASDLSCAAPEERCLPQHVFGAESECRCVSHECTQDTDCGAGRVCACGDEVCGYPSWTHCGNVCVQGDCSSDADCGPTGVCSPSPDPCGYRAERYACHDSTVDECFSHAECPPNSLCRNPDGTGWRCESRPMCD